MSVTDKRDSLRYFDVLTRQLLFFGYTAEGLKAKVDKIVELEKTKEEKR